jgi:hypothetical protein
MLQMLQLRLEMQAGCQLPWNYLLRLLQVRNKSIRSCRSHNIGYLQSLLRLHSRARAWLLRSPATGGFFTSQSAVQRV